MTITTEHFASGTTPTKQDTIRYLLVKELLATNAGGGSGSGIGEVLHGAFATPVGNVTPTTTSKSAIYSQDGAANNNLWRWDVPDQTWYQIIGP